MEDLLETIGDADLLEAIAGTENGSENIIEGINGHRTRRNSCSTKKFSFA